MNTFRLFAALPLLALAATAAARPVLDQDAPYGEETIVVGGARDIVVSQSVTAGVAGDLMRIEVGVGCDGGALIVEIVNVEPGREAPRIGAPVRASVTVDAATIPNPPAMHTFELDRWPSMRSGDRFAIVLRNPTGSCTVMKGAMAADGSSYPRGRGILSRRCLRRLAAVPRFRQDRRPRIQDHRQRAPHLSALHGERLRLPVPELAPGLPLHRR